MNKRYLEEDYDEEEVFHSQFRKCPSRKDEIIVYNQFRVDETLGSMLKSLDDLKNKSGS